VTRAAARQRKDILSFLDEIAAVLVYQAGLAPSAENESSASSQPPPAAMMVERGGFVGVEFFIIFTYRARTTTRPVI
jgi:hypothetical protein